MRFLTQLAIAAAASIFGTAVAMPRPLTVTPGNVNDIVITANNTVNATHRSDFVLAASTSGLPISLVNNLAGAGVNCYITGLDNNGQLVMVKPDGSFFYPSANGATTPQAVTTNIAIPLGGYHSTKTITIPSYISAGRIWFAQGNLQFFVIQGGNGPVLVEPSAVNPNDPSANVNWGFVELTWTQAGGVFANISYVDFVGLVLGMKLTNKDGSTQSAPGLQGSAVTSICNALQNQQNADGQPWGDLCVKSTSGQPLRVLNPTDYISIHPGAFSNYWSSYVDQVWSHYSSNTLTINTQAAAGNVACKVTNNVLNCAGDNRGYAKPSAADIFSCNSGPFGFQSGDNAVHYNVVPRLCAAFDRSTLLLGGGNTQPGPAASQYYSVSPTNWYSKIVHQNEIGGTGYAFSYDDVAPNGGVNAAGTVSSGNPSQLQVTVGGP